MAEKFSPLLAEQKGNTMGKVKYNSKTKQFFRGKGFYLVACACMIAVGAAAWSAIAQLPQPPIDSGEVSSEAPMPSYDQTPSAEQSPVDAVVSNQPDTREEPQNSSVPESTQAAAPVASFFVPPVVGDILKTYSDTELQYSETFCDMRLHLGVDILADNGTAVTAAGEGTVTEVGGDVLWGNYVVIDHGNGIAVKYCGLAEDPPVKTGDTVDSKTQIGVLATIPCESVERAHLHLSVTKDGNPIDPMSILGLQ